MALDLFEAFWATIQVIQDQEGLRNDILTNAAGYVAAAGAQGANIPALIAICQQNAVAYQARLTRQANIPAATRNALVTFMNGIGNIGSDMVANFNNLQAEVTLEVSGAAALTDGPSIVTFGNAIIARFPAHFRLW